MASYEMTSVNNTQFLNEAWSIEQNIEKVSNNITSIREIQSRIVVAVSTTQESALAQERDQLAYETKKILLDIKENIKRLAIESLKFKRDNPNHPEISVRTQRQEYVKQKFTKTLETYREVEDGFMKQQKERMTRQYRVVNPDATQAEIDNYLINPSDQPVFASALLRTGEAKDALVEVKKRHNDIRQIEQTIAELADLFKELELQVEIQDETIINVENVVVDTTEKIKVSSNKLEEATVLAKAARNKKWTCLGIVFLVVLVIVVVIVVLKKSGSL